MPIQIILAKMELHGFGLDKDHLLELNNTVNKIIENISEQGYELSGTRFNMQSTLEWAKVKKNYYSFNYKLNSLNLLVR